MAVLVAPPPCAAPRRPGRPGHPPLLPALSVCERQTEMSTHCTRRKGQRARRPARLLDAQVLARQARAQARLDLAVRAARGLRDQRRLHVQRAARLQLHIPAPRAAR